MKNEKPQSKESLGQSIADQVGAFVLAGATLFSMVAASKHGPVQAREIVLQQPTNVFQHVSDITERENETARIPVKFDDGLRLPTTSGA
ncbi:MAG TPA: hypothetical protein VNE40_04115 [Candidatus Dormibacteraeota bacterium]|nr:hypothetical protein [Candidatus Dormibacteraeota bacterium]